MLDTSVVIDGRIADVVETKILDNQLIMPRFVIAELQAMADSADRLRRSRGRRGLDILNRLSDNTEVDLQNLRSRASRIRRPAGRPQAGATGQVLARQNRHQRLQPEQGRPAAWRRRDQSERRGQRAQAGLAAW